MQINYKLVPISSVLFSKIVDCMGKLVIRSFTSSSGKISLQKLSPTHCLLIEFIEYFAEITSIKDNSQGSHDDAKVWKIKSKSLVSLNEICLFDFSMFCRTNFTLEFRRQVKRMTGFFYFSSITSIISELSFVEIS